MLVADGLVLRKSSRWKSMAISVTKKMLECRSIDKNSRMAAVAHGPLHSDLSARCRYLRTAARQLRFETPLKFSCRGANHLDASSGSRKVISISHRYRPSSNNACRKARRKGRVLKCHFKGNACGVLQWITELRATMVCRSGSVIQTEADINGTVFRVEKYRPVFLDDVVGNTETIERLKIIAKEGNMPHVIISGMPGIGKTTSVLCLARQLLGESYKEAVLELNASDERGTSDSLFVVSTHNWSSVTANQVI